MKNYYEKSSSDEKSDEKIVGTHEKVVENNGNSQSQSQPEILREFEEIKYPAKIAVYDNLLSTPRVITIEPTDVASYLNEITTTTYDLAKQQGGMIPYSVIRELVENFIHAYFIEPTVSIMEQGNKIRFTDQGPGIQNINLAQKVGVTSATKDMKKYIRGVGSGLPVVKEYLQYAGGQLSIENNIKSGTVVTISTVHVGGDAGLSESQREQHQQPAEILSDREVKVLELTGAFEMVGPTEINNELGISVSTAYRVLTDLENKGYLVANSSGDKKRVLTQKGSDYLQNAFLRLHPNG